MNFVGAFERSERAVEGVADATARGWTSASRWIYLPREREPHSDGVDSAISTEVLGI